MASQHGNFPSMEDGTIRYACYRSCPNDSFRDDDRWAPFRLLARNDCNPALICTVLLPRTARTGFLRGILFGIDFVSAEVFHPMKRLAFTLITAILAAGPFNQKLTSAQQIIHALNRLTFGPRPGDSEQVRRI